MRAMLKPRLSMAVVLAAGTLAVSSCSSGDTIVSLNYSFDDATAGDVKISVTKLHVDIGAASGGSVQTDVDISHDSDGGITSASYKRITVNGLSGKATIIVTALGSGDKELLIPKATTPDNAPVTIVEHEVTAAFVKFARTPTPDAGTEMDAAGSGGSTGSGGSEGSGGSGSSGGSSGSGGSGSGGSGSGGSG